MEILPWLVRGIFPKILPADRVRVEDSNKAVHKRVKIFFMIYLLKIFIDYEIRITQMMEKKHEL